MKKAQGKYLSKSMHAGTLGWNGVGQIQCWHLITMQGDGSPEEGPASQSMNDWMCLKSWTQEKKTSKCWIRELWLSVTVLWSQSKFIKVSVSCLCLSQHFVLFARVQREREGGETWGETQREKKGTTYLLGWRDVVDIGPERQKDVFKYSTASGSHIQNKT